MSANPASPSATADLHLHTIASDGVLTATEVVDAAGAAGLAACAITDHDTLAALPEARRAAAQAGLELVPGIEISTALDGASIHLLGYFVDEASSELEAMLARQRTARRERGRAMVERLIELDVQVDMETVEALAGEAPIGRPHIADALVRGGKVATFQEAFDRYIGIHAPAYVERMTLHPREAIGVVKRAGGVTSLAHPGTLRRDDLIPEMADAGLDAIEVWHPRHNETARQRYLEVAERHRLIATGGSDFHGGDRGDSEVGSQAVPVTAVDALRQAAGR